MGIESRSNKRQTPVEEKPKLSIIPETGGMIEDGEVFSSHSEVKVAATGAVQVFPSSGESDTGQISLRTINKIKASWADPTRREHRRKSLVEAWERDKDARVARVWSQDARQKRRKAFEKYDKNNPDAIIHGNRKHMLDRQRALLGERPGEALYRLRHIEQKTNLQIAEELGISHVTIARWMKEEGVPRLEAKGRLRSPIIKNSYRELVESAIATGAWDELTKDQQAILEARYISRKSLKTLAAETGTTTQNCSERALNGLRRLKEILSYKKIPRKKE